MWEKITGLFGKRRTLREHLTETKTVKVRNILFTIRKLSPLDHLAGAETLVNHFDTYKTATDNNLNANDFSKNQKVIKKHYGDVIMSAVVKPELTRKDSPGEAIHIDEVLMDFELSQELYKEIMFYTYGKKKILQSTYLANNL